jgi:hypothetical protein
LVRVAAMYFFGARASIVIWTTRMAVPHSAGGPHARDNAANGTQL